MNKVLDACTIIRLVRIGLFDEVVTRYSGKLYIADSALREVSRNPSKKMLNWAISSGLVRVYKVPKRERDNAYKQIHGFNIKLHYDDVPNIVASKKLGAELVTDDHVLFDAVHRWRHALGIKLFVMNTRGLLFELMLSGKLDLIIFIKGILDLFRYSELPNTIHQLEKDIITLKDVQQLFGEYENYLLKAVRLSLLGQR